MSKSSCVSWRRQTLNLIRMQCQFQFPLGKLYFLIWSSCWGETPNGKWALISQQTRKHRVEYPVHWGQQKIPVRVGVSVLPFLAVTLLNEVYMSWKQQNGPRVLETNLKNKKDGGRVAEEFVLAQFPRRFLEIFFALSTPHGFRSNSKENKQTIKNVFIVFLGLRDFGGFKGRREMSRFAFACYGHPEFNSSIAISF